MKQKQKDSNLPEKQNIGKKSQTINPHIPKTIKKHRQLVRYSSTPQIVIPYKVNPPSNTLNSDNNDFLSGLWRLQHEIKH